MRVDLSDAITRLAPVPKEEIERFRAFLKPVRLCKGEIFLLEGQNAWKFAFVEEGLFRFYHVQEDGAEATRAFIMEGGFLAARVSIARGEPSPYSIEALENSVILSAVRPFEGVWYPANPSWSDFMTAFYQERLDYKDRRVYGFLTKDAAGRYLDFLADYPGLEDRVCQHHIASYLGVTPVTLSRIRSRLRKRGELPG